MTVAAAGLLLNKGKKRGGNDHICGIQHHGDYIIGLGCSVYLNVGLVEVLGAGDAVGLPFIIIRHAHCGSKIASRLR